MTELAEGILEGNQRALARAITTIENRDAGYRDLVSTLYRAATDAEVVGITGPPGVGKSTLVDRLIESYRADDLTVGVLAIDPASPFSGGAVLGDRVRLRSAVGDDGVFVRSMSARGTLGGLAAATDDAVIALEAFGVDRVIVETVGAGQNEVDVVQTADTVTVVLQPGSGDDVQTLKAGLLEIADVFAVNKADLDGADRLVSDLRSMIDLGDQDAWTPPIVETVATAGTGIEALREALSRHMSFLNESDHRADENRRRIRAAIRSRLQGDLEALMDRELDDRDLNRAIDRVLAREADPYGVADELLAAIAEGVVGADHDDGE